MEYFVFAFYCCSTIFCYAMAEAIGEKDMHFLNLIGVCLFIFLFFFFGALAISMLASIIKHAK